MPLIADPTRAAILPMDCQAGLVAAYVKEPDAWLARAAAAVAAARAAGVRVIHVKVGFRPDLPEVSPRNAVFAPIKASGRHQQLFQGARGAVHPALGPAPDDLVVTKSRVSAFTGTDLEILLRARDVETLVLFGIATSGVVLSTLTDAVDRDYRLVVIGDCCADLDPDLHDALVQKFFPRRATVVSAAAFADAVEAT